MYWLTGNLFIYRNNRTKPRHHCGSRDHFKNSRISIWDMFPGNPQPWSRPMFKTGAFHAAIAAGVPLFPCAS
ncbi:hypothetical protein ACLK19_20095 [Escherichia coli]